MRYSGAGIATATALVVILSSVAIAQDQDEAAKAPKLGGFFVDPRLVVTERYDDNIFSTRNDKTRDFVTVVAPSVTAELDTERHALSFEAGAELGRYAEFDDEDYEDWYVGGDGRIDLAPGTFLFGGIRHDADHEERESPDDVAGAEPTEFTSTRAYAGAAIRADRLRVRVGATAVRLDFDDVPAGGGAMINNDDRDRDTYEIGGRMTYLAAPGLQPFVQGLADVRRYEDGRDDFGFNRDSAGFTAAAGLGLGFAGGVELELLAGIAQQNYEDRALEDVTVPDVGATLLWPVGPDTTVEASLDRTIEETTIPLASAYVRTAGNVRLEHRLRADLNATATLNYSSNDYRGIRRTDHVVSGGLALRHYLTPLIFLGADYAFVQRDSNVPGADYDNHLLFARAGVQLVPAYDDDDLQGAGPFGAGGLSGFYVGAQAGIDGLRSAINGPRRGGALVADFGDHGLVGGLFAGYEFDFDRWRLALELEGEGADTEWEHARSPGGRVFSVAKNHTYGGALRLGRVFPGGAVFYGRAGLVLSEFESDYVSGPTIVHQTDTEAGLRVGTGVELPLGGGAALRLDYTYTAYEDFNVFVGTARENYANNETLLRAGLAYRFGRPSAPEPVGHRFDGFYAGAQGGYGTLGSENVGPRAAPSILTADRAGHGTTGGGFVGYGARLANFYVGLEAEVEAADANWDIDRDTTRRVYTVDKQWSIGASARAGLIVNDSALVYGRVGANRTRFDTRYIFAGATFDQSDSVTGLRVGGGIEVAATDHVFVRMDYTYTDYEAFDVNYVAASDNFDNAESLFRVGAGYRF